MHFFSFLRPQQWNEEGYGGEIASHEQQKCFGQRKKVGYRVSFARSLNVTSIPTLRLEEKREKEGGSEENPKKWGSMEKLHTTHVEG